MLKRRATRIERVLQVVVEQAANRGHVDVCKAREAAGEICRVVIRAEQAAKLTVEHVLRLRPATSRARRYSHGENGEFKKEAASIYRCSVDTTHIAITEWKPYFNIRVWLKHVPDSH